MTEITPDDAPGGGGVWPLRGEGPVTVLAHRGGSGPWRENTLEAFAGALAGGADGVELDVRASADDALVVVHDAEVPGVGPVHEHDRAGLPPWVPSLGDALAVCAGALVDVEIKNLPTEAAFDPDERVAGAVAALLADPVPGGPAGVVVSSFWPGALAAVARARPELPLGLLVHPSLDTGAALAAAADLGCRALHPHWSRVDPSLVTEAHRRRLAVVAWTVNAPDELAAVVEAGVDVVVTDDVASVLARLGRG